MSDELKLTAESGIAVLTLNRPERLNALTKTMLSGLRTHLAALAEDPEIGCVVLTGSGRAFCSGGDVRVQAANAGKSDLSPELRADQLRASMEASRLLHDMPKPTIAMLNGVAAGAGMSLALACDLRIGGESARMTTAFAKVGLSGDYGGTYFLTQMLGSAKARELYLLSPVLTAQEALALGMVTRVVPDAEVEASARELAMSLAQGPTITLGYIKRNINNAERLPLETCFDAEAFHHSRAGETADHKEAAKAFVEKRKPVFKNH